MRPRKVPMTFFLFAFPNSSPKSARFFRMIFKLCHAAYWWALPFDARWWGEDATHSQTGQTDQRRCLHDVEYIVLRFFSKWGVVQSQSRWLFHRGVFIPPPGNQSTRYHTRKAGRAAERSCLLVKEGSKGVPRGCAWYGNSVTPAWSQRGRRECSKTAFLKTSEPKTWKAKQSNGKQGLVKLKINF